MGDEADALIDAAMDLYFTVDDESEDGYYREAKCRDCGSTHVYWSKEDGRWVLFNTNDRKHRCNTKKLTKIRIEAFDTL